MRKKILKKKFGWWGLMSQIQYIYLVIFGNMQNMKVENIKCPFILWAIVAISLPKNREFVVEYSFSKILFTRRQKFATKKFVVLMPWCLH
jgi:hypothetical protein